MITNKEMRECKGKKIRLTYTDGDAFIEKCICYHQAEVEDEEAMLEFESGMVNQSQIKKIEILD